MTLKQSQNLKTGDTAVAKLVNSKQSHVNPVTNIDRGNIKLRRKIDSKSSPHITIKVKSNTKV